MWTLRRLLPSWAVQLGVFVPCCLKVVLLEKKRVLSGLSAGLFNVRLGCVRLCVSLASLGIQKNLCLIATKARHEIPSMVENQLRN